MTRMLWMFAALVAGCGGSSSSNPPDAPPAVVDAARTAPDAEPCKAGAPTPGDYALTWKCVSGCDGGAPFAYYDRLSIANDLTLTYSRTTCSSCDPVTDVGTAAAGGCVAGNGIPLGGGATSSAYKLCPATCGFKGTVSWTRTPGPGDMSRWTVVGNAP